MLKSNKRMKLEHEIFATSIQDIEQMFSGSWSEADNEDVRPRKVSACLSSSQNIDLSILNGQESQIASVERRVNTCTQDCRNNFHSLVPPVNAIDGTKQFSRLDLPAGTCLGETAFDYDCINMSLFSEAQSEETSFHSAHQVLPTSTFMQHPPSPDYAVLSRNMLSNLNEEMLDDYMFELDLKLYLPRINLESDLRMIDLLITRPLSVMN